jgi:hypothetical protein
MSSPVLAALERARARFRQDVADQLRIAAEKAGVPAAVTLDDERDAPVSDGVLPRLVAAFGDDRDGEPAGSERVILYVDTGEERRTLLTLAWRDAPSLEEAAAIQHRLAALEARTDERLPLERRGLNAPADVRTGRYANGDLVRPLAGDLKRSAAQASRALDQPHGLAAIEPPRPASTRAPRRAETDNDSGRRAQQAPLVVHIETQRANVSELLVSRLMQAMQRDLAEAESHFVGPGVAASARGRVGRAMEWAMIGTAYGVEAKTNQIAVSSFLGGGERSQCVFS